MIWRKGEDGWDVGREGGKKETRQGGREEEILSTFSVLGLAFLEITENFVIALRSNRRKTFCTLTRR